MLESMAAYYRLGLQLGTHSVADVITWADSEIAELVEPPVELIDLALMQNSSRADVAGKLGALTGTIKALDVLDSVLGKAHEVLKTDPTFGPTLAHGLYALYEECSYEIPDRLIPIAGFDDEYALAMQGTYGTVEDVYLDLLAFTGQFQDAP